MVMFLLGSGIYYHQRGGITQASFASQVPEAEWVKTRSESYGFYQPVNVGEIPEAAIPRENIAPKRYRKHKEGRLPVY
jgi:hypothetical protein